MSTDHTREAIEQAKGDLDKLKQRMEGNSASQIHRAIHANRYNRFIPGWLRPVIFPLAIFALFATGLFLFKTLIEYTEIPAPWDINNPNWAWWNLIHFAQIALTGWLCWQGERIYGKLPGIPRGSLYSILVLATLLPVLILALVVASRIFARLQIRRGQSGVWMRSMGGWTTPIIVTGAVEVVVLWITFMLLSSYAGSNYANVNAAAEAGSTVWATINDVLTVQGLKILVASLAVIGLIQALSASISIICEAAIEEDAIDVTPLLGTLAPLVVLSPICLYMLVAYAQAENIHHLWLLIFRVLAVLWVIMVLIGMNYLVRRWEIVHQQFLIMLMGYLLMIPFFVFRAQDASAVSEPITPEETQQMREGYEPDTKKSPRAIDLLRDL